MIAPMKRVSIVCMRDDREQVMRELQHSSLMMITASDVGVPGSDTVSGDGQRRVDKLLNELSRYSKKKGLFEQPEEISRAEFDTISSDAVELTDRLEETVERKSSLLAEEKSLNASLELLLPWQSLSCSVTELEPTDATVTIIGKLPVAKTEDCKSELNELCIYETVSSNDKTEQLLIIVLKENEADARRALLGYGFEEAHLPLSEGTVSEGIADIGKRLNELSREKEAVFKQLEEIADSSKTDLETLFEQYRAGASRAEIRLEETLETVFIEGWVREDCTDRLTQTIKNATDIFDIVFRTPEDGEDVPTSLTNNKTVSQFEGITEMFDPPKYGDFDPNAVMAPWYWIIFGMMMGDVGYGLMMAVLILLAKKVMKPRGNTAKLMNVFLYSSITTMLFGALFGSYFGEELLPPILPFTAMGDPIKMLILTIVIGVLHIFTGMITKMVLDIRQGHIRDALFDQLSWMLVITGIGMLFIKPLNKIGMVLAIFGALVILFTAGRKKKGFFGKVAGGLGGLYNISSYFSDILSYSRILALSLSTGVVGMVMNLLAGMVQVNAIGFVLSLVIYIVGHVFNLALGLLSAYVHACRLQYIEFYGKFYEGGGTMFKPFGIKTNYINIK